MASKQTYHQKAEALPALPLPRIQAPSPPQQKCSAPLVETPCQGWSSAEPEEGLLAKTAITRHSQTKESTARALLKTFLEHPYFFPLCCFSLFLPGIHSGERKLCLCISLKENFLFVIIYSMQLHCSASFICFPYSLKQAPRKYGMCLIHHVSPALEQVLSK